MLANFHMFTDNFKNELLGTTISLEICCCTTLRKTIIHGHTQYSRLRIDGVTADHTMMHVHYSNGVTI